MKKKYTLTEEHKKQLAPWSKRWIANAMSTAAMTSADRAQCREAVVGLYAAAGLPAPRVVFASGPISGAFAGVFATDDATDAATYDATVAATYAATYAATRAATRAATVAATYAATYAATRDATYDTIDGWLVVPGLAQIAQVAQVANRHKAAGPSPATVRQGGNQWPGFDCFLSFFRHVVGLGIDYTKYAHWETLALCSGVRYVYRDLCIVCDRPSKLVVDDQNRPHCEDGPFCVWRDGVALYAWHGVYTPRDWIEDKKNLDPRIALTHENVELRRVCAEIVGWARVLDCVDAVVVDKDADESIGTLLRADLPDAEGSQFLRVRCGTGRDFVLPVPSEMRSARAANAWTYNIPESELVLDHRT